MKFLSLLLILCLFFGVESVLETNDLLSKLDNIIEEVPKKDALSTKINNSTISIKVTKETPLKKKVALPLAKKAVKNDDDELGSIKKLLQSPDIRKRNEDNLFNVVKENLIPIPSQETTTESATIKIGSSVQPQTLMTNPVTLVSNNYIQGSENTLKFIPNFPSTINAFPKPIVKESPPRDEKSELIMRLLQERKRRLAFERASLSENKETRPKQTFSKSTFKDSNIIFEHLYIDQNGENGVTLNNLSFDNFNKEFLLPQEILKEDDILKWKRIESILQSMEFQSNDQQKPNRKKFIMNPPILKGVESSIGSGEVVKREIPGPFAKNKVVTRVIKSDSDNNYFKMSMEAKKNIRSPPNFF